MIRFERKLVGAGSPEAHKLVSNSLSHALDLAEVDWELSEIKCRRATQNLKAPLSPHKKNLMMYSTIIAGKAFQGTP